MYVPASLPELAFHVELALNHATDELSELSMMVETMYAGHKHMPGVVDHMRSIEKMTGDLHQHLRIMLDLPDAEPPAEYLQTIDERAERADAEIWLQFPALKGD